MQTLVPQIHPFGSFTNFIIYKKRVVYRKTPAKTLFFLFQIDMGTVNTFVQFLFPSDTTVTFDLTSCSRDIRKKLGKRYHWHKKTDSSNNLTPNLTHPRFNAKKFFVVVCAH